MRHYIRIYTQDQGYQIAFRDDNDPLDTWFVETDIPGHMGDSASALVVRSLNSEERRISEINSR
jgi:hypothetical protein